MLQSFDFALDSVSAQEMHHFGHLKNNLERCARYTFNDLEKCPRHTFELER